MAGSIIDDRWRPWHLQQEDTTFSISSWATKTSPSSGGQELEKELFWVFDDLHCPHPLSPMFYEIGGWWLTCDHMFRRFGTPFAVDWVTKNVNGYLYTAAVPADPSWTVDAMEYGNRYGARVPLDDGTASASASTSTPSCPSMASTSSTGGATASCRRCSATSSSSRSGWTTRTT